MVEGHPYGEKADVWALGCILYQMCALDPPFFNSNMLTLVKSVSFTSEPEHEILILILLSHRLPAKAQISLPINSINFICFCCCLLIFVFKINFFEKSITLSNGLVPDQD